MMHAWAALFAAALVIAASWASGVPLLDWCGAKIDGLESAPLRFLTGACLLHLAIFAVMAAKIAYKPVFLILLGGAIVSGVIRNRRIPVEFPLKHRIAFLFGAIFAAYFVFFLANAWAPETSSDGAGYHLEIVSQYLRARGFLQLPANMYSGLGQGVELLYAPAVALGGFSAAALVHFAFLLALVWAIFAYGARIGKPWAGAAAALLVFVSPVVSRDGTTAYVDVAAAAIVFAVFYWLEIWDRSRNSRLLVPIGLLGGYAYAAKFTASVMLLYALAFLAWRARRIRPVLIAAGCAALVMAPWMIKDWVYFHNPVAPFADEIFPNAYIHLLTEQQWAEWLRHYDLPHFRDLPWQVTVRGDYTQGILGPIFLLSPLALLALRRTSGWRVLLPGLAMLAVYFGNIGTRFLIPCLPFFALGIALAIGNRWLLTALVSGAAVLSWPSAIPRYANPYVWRIEEFPWRAALRIQPESQYLREHIRDYAILQMINDKVPPGERVFFTGDIGWMAYGKPEIVDHFRGAFGNTIWDILNIGWKAAMRPLRLIVFHFPERDASRIRLVETAQAAKDQQWSVHELRFFDRGAEITRGAGWRLRAWPNPFEVQLAFDNSQATRWRTWQTASPGMSLDVDFGGVQRLAEVRMETSVDPPWPIQLRVESLERGRWVTVADRFDSSANQVSPAIRRAASYEVLHRGIKYIVVRDQDFGAADYNDDPAQWGFETVAAVPGAILYRILP